MGDVRGEAERAVQAINERHFTPEALEHSIHSLARHVIALDDEAAPLRDVAHAAWHLMDDSGEHETDTDDNGEPLYSHLAIDHQRLSEVLGTLEASGWGAHKEADDAS